MDAQNLSFMDPFIYITIVMICDVTKRSFHRLSLYQNSHRRRSQS